MSLIEQSIGQKPPRSRARLWVSVLLLAIYGGFVSLVTLWPDASDFRFGSIADNVLGVLHRFGVPESFGFNELEFTANIGMFVPLGFFLGLALHRKVWWLALFIIPGYSGFIEFTQGAALEARVSSVMDVVANTAGGYLGLLLAMCVRAMIYSRDDRIIARAIWERDASIIRARQHPLPDRPAAAQQPDGFGDLLDARTRVMPQRSEWGDAQTQQLRY